VWAQGKQQNQLGAKQSRQVRIVRVGLTTIPIIPALEGGGAKKGVVRTATSTNPDQKKNVKPGHMEPVGIGNTKTRGQHGVNPYKWGGETSFPPIFTHRQKGRCLLRRKKERPCLGGQKGGPIQTSF